MDGRRRCSTINSWPSLREKPGSAKPFGGSHPKSHWILLLSGAVHRWEETSEFSLELLGFKCRSIFSFLNLPEAVSQADTRSECTFSEKMKSHCELPAHHQVAERRSRRLGCYYRAAFSC